MKKTIQSITIITILFVCFASCQSDKYITPPKFNSVRAFEYLEKQVSFGPRVPGTQSSALCRNFLYETFLSAQIPVDSQSFTFFDIYSQENIPMVNVIGSYIADPKLPTIVLMAHYDCRPRTDYPNLKNLPIDGASDGASGVAVLLELANMCAEQKPSINIDFVLVDGEDWGKSGDIQFYMLGSKEFARRGIRGKYKFGIVVDMVGDKDLTIYREQYSENSAKSLNDLIFETAKNINAKGFIDSVKYAISDDHLSLITAGIPAIDIIDFDYKYWHTAFDSPENCSKESLESVGNVLAEIIYNKTLWQKVQ